MPRYDSKEGVWHPAHEYVVLPHAEKGKEVYEGEDRAALWEMQQAGLIDKDGNKIDYFGTHFRKDAEFLQRIRQLGYNSLEEYLKLHSYDEKKNVETFEKSQKKVTQHKERNESPAIKEPAGGVDKTNPNNTIYGSFGDHGEALEKASKRGSK